MEHKHKYDAQGKQLCCTLEEKINHKTDKQTGCCPTHNDSENHFNDVHKL